MDCKNLETVHCFNFTITRFYADDGEDIVLIYSKRNDRFYALGAVCSHEGTNTQKS